MKENKKKKSHIFSKIIIILILLIVMAGGLALAPVKQVPATNNGTPNTTVEGWTSVIVNRATLESLVNKVLESKQVDAQFYLTKDGGTLIGEQNRLEYRIEFTPAVGDNGSLNLQLDRAYIGRLPLPKSIVISFINKLLKQNTTTQQIVTLLPNNEGLNIQFEEHGLALNIKKIDLTNDKITLGLQYGG